MKCSIAMLAAALLALAPPTAQARDPGAREAKHACKQAARAQYGATGFDHVTAANHGGGSYKVVGVMHRRDRADARLRCRYSDGRVAGLSVKRADGDGLDAGEAIGAALGIAVGAAILGAISSDHSHDDYRAPSGGSAYVGRGAYSPASRIACYRRQRACYHADGRFAARWTEREFGSVRSQDYRASRVDEGQLRMYCAGEASRRFHRHPRDIRIDELTRSRDAYTVYGSFDHRSGRAGFICRFDSRGGFRWINRA
jgi:hypothetical protein